MEVRRALKTLFQKPQSQQTYDAQKMFDAQAEATALRLDKNQAHASTEVAAMRPNTWAARVNPHTGNILQVERKCWCGQQQTYPGLEVFTLVGPNIKQICPVCKRQSDFARDSFMCLLPAPGPVDASGKTQDWPREEALKGYNAFFARAKDHGISIDDYAKGVDGNYWLSHSKTYALLTMFNFIPTTAADEADDGPVFLPIGDADLQVNYEAATPDALADASAEGIASAVEYHSRRAATPEDDAWMEKRRLAHERHNRAYGPDAQLRKLDAAIAEIESSETRAQLRLAILRDDADEVARIQREISSERVRVAVKISETENLVTTQARNVDFIEAAYQNFRGSVSEVEARSLLAKIETRDV